MKKQLFFIDFWDYNSNYSHDFHWNKLGDSWPDAMSRHIFPLMFRRERKEKENSRNFKQIGANKIEISKNLGTKEKVWEATNPEALLQQYVENQLIGLFFLSFLEVLVAFLKVTYTSKEVVWIIVLCSTLWGFGCFQAGLRFFVEIAK